TAAKSRLGAMTHLQQYISPARPRQFDGRGTACGQHELYPTLTSCVMRKFGFSHNCWLVNQSLKSWSQISAVTAHDRSRAPRGERLDGECGIGGALIDGNAPLPMRHPKAWQAL